MSELNATQSALQLHSTARPPTLGFAESIHQLSAAAKRLPSPSKDALGELVAKDAALQDAVLAFLKYRMTFLHERALLPGLELGAVYRTALALVPRLGPSRRYGFVQDVAFNVFQLALHRDLAPALLACVSGEALDELLLEHATSQNELHAWNTFGMLYALESAGHRLSDGARAQLRTAAISWAQDARANTLLRDVAMGFVTRGAAH